MTSLFSAAAMPISVQLPLFICWATITSYWIYHANHKKAHKFIEPQFKQILCYWLPFFSAAALLAPCPWLDNLAIGQPMFTANIATYTLGIAFAATGVALGIWARISLAENWSGNVTLKQGHQLVTDGPYQLVRHPIYTAFLLLFLGTAICNAQWRGLLAFLLVYGSFFIKLRSEEQLMHHEFGDAYRDYRAQSGALLPNPFKYLSYKKSR